MYRPYSPPVVKPTNTTTTTSGGCTCKKSRCLKLYCQCFSMSTCCGTACQCLDCKNSIEGSHNIAFARRAILECNPSAFDDKFPMNTTTTNVAAVAVPLVAVAAATATAATTAAKNDNYSKKQQQQQQELDNNNYRQQEDNHSKEQQEDDDEPMAQESTMQEDDNGNHDSNNNNKNNMEGEQQQDNRATVLDRTASDSRIVAQAATLEPDTRSLSAPLLVQTTTTTTSTTTEEAAPAMLTTTPTTNAATTTTTKTTTTPPIQLHRFGCKCRHSRCLKSIVNVTKMKLSQPPHLQQPDESAYWQQQQNRQRSSPPRQAPPPPPSSVRHHQPPYRGYSRHSSPPPHHHRLPPPYHPTASVSSSLSSLRYQRQEYDEGMYTYSEPLPLADNMTESIHSATLIYNVGQTHVRRGKYYEAKKWFELALVHLRVEPSQDAAVQHLSTHKYAMRIYHHLGHCYYRLGRNEDAMRCYRKSLEKFAQDDKKRLF